MSFRWICSAVWQCMSAEMLPEQKNATIIKRQNVPILVTSSPYTTPYNIVFMWYHIFCLCVVVSNGYYPCNVDFPRSKNWEREDRHLYEQNQQRNYKKYFVVKCCLTAFLLAAPSPTLPSHWSSQRLLLTHCYALSLLLLLFHCYAHFNTLARACYATQICYYHVITNLLIGRASGCY